MKSISLLLLFFCLVSVLKAQQPTTISVEGIILTDGEPLPGANILIKGTDRGTVAGTDGTFSITVNPGDVIVVRFIGFVTREFTIENDDYLEIELREDLYESGELVVVGYGTVRKSDLTGSVSSISARDIQATSVSSIEQGIQGRAAGVIITQTSGQPGSGTTIRIRGTSSINANNEPLYVIDGVPVISDAGQMRTGAVRGPAMNPLASINPDDIESIEILKDASAAAIYGARGANGVIIVTTKTGTRAGTEVSFGYYTGFQSIASKIPMLNARQLAELGNEAADNAGVIRRVIYASPNNLGEGTDWQDEIFDSAPISNYQLSVHGRNEGTRYSISGNYFDQQGIILNSGFDKGNLRLNLDQRISDRVDIGTKLNLTRSTLQGTITDFELAIPSSVTTWALEFNPGLPVFNSDGDYIYQNNTSQPSVGNPVADALETQQKSKSTRVIGNANVRWKIFDNIELRSSLGVDWFLNEEQFFIPNFLKRAEASNGQAALGDSKGYTWLIENILSYNNQFRNKHSVNLMAGHTIEKFENDFLYVATSDFEDNRLGFNAIQGGNQNTLSLSGGSGWQMQSVLSRINYSYDNRYLVTATGRVDGSSKFGDGNKYGFFPSFSVAWRIDQEDFFSDVESINQFKLRAGYGVVGNEGIPPYSSLGTLEITEAYFGENDIAKGAGPGTLENADLKWERTAQINTGIDINLFNDRITLSTDYYIKKTTDLLLNAPVPYISGFDFAFTNIGELENRGFEFSINSFNTTGTVHWKTSLTFATNSNKITKLTGFEDAGLTGQSLLGITGWTRIEEGQPIGTFYGYQSDGIIQTGDDLSSIPHFANYTPTYGDRKYVDQNGDGIINENDKVILGNANPDFSFGIGNEFAYRNFTLNIFMQGVYGNEIINFNRFSLESFDGTKNNSTAALERWTPDNPTNKYPRANALPPGNVLSDVQVEDGSYLRIQDITLGYNLPVTVTGRVGLQSVRFYVSAKNIYTFTNYSGYDPEVSRFSNDNLSMGADFGSYPRSRMILSGVNITF